MGDQFRMTPRRRDTLALVRSGLVQRDLEQGCWLINTSPARRWHGRTLSELEQAELITVDSKPTKQPPVSLTARGEVEISRAS